MRIAAIEDLAIILRRICPTEAIKDKFLSGITTTLAHLREIEMWFQAGVGAVSAESVLREVRLFQKCGVFVGRTPRHDAGGGLELEYVVGDSTLRQSSDVLLQTLLSAVFSRGEELPGDGSAALATFIEAHGAAEDAVAAMAAAEADGLPYMQRCARRLGPVAEPQHLRDFAAGVRRSTDEWKSVIAEALESCPRLRFLDRAQLLMFMRLVGAVGAASPAPDLPRFPAAHIPAYLAICFPDVESDGGDESPVQRLASAVRGVVDDEFGCDDGDGDGAAAEGPSGGGRRRTRRRGGNEG